MTVTSQDVCIYAADSELISVALVDANGDPFVLAPGGDIEWRLAQTSHDADADCIVRKKLGDGILLQDSVAEITLSKFNTAVPPGIYFHQLTVIDPSTDDVTVAMIGNFVVRRALRMPQTETGAATLGGAGAVACSATLV